MKYGLLTFTPQNNENVTLIHASAILYEDPEHLGTVYEDHLYKACAPKGVVQLSEIALTEENVESEGYSPMFAFDPETPSTKYRRQGVVKNEAKRDRPLDVKSCSPEWWHGLSQDDSEVQKTLLIDSDQYPLEVELLDGRVVSPNTPSAYTLTLEAWLKGVKGRTVVCLLAGEGPNTVLLDIMHLGGISLRSLPRMERLVLAEALTLNTGERLQSITSLFPSTYSLRHLTTNWCDDNELLEKAFVHEKLMLSFTTGFDFEGDPHFYLVKPYTLLTARVLHVEEVEVASIPHFNYGIGLLNPHCDEDELVTNLTHFNEVELDSLIEIKACLSLTSLEGEAKEFLRTPISRLKQLSAEQADSIYVEPNLATPSTYTP